MVVTGGGFLFGVGGGNIFGAGGGKVLVIYTVKNRPLRLRRRRCTPFDRRPREILIIKKRVSLCLPYPALITIVISVLSNSSRGRLWEHRANSCYLRIM